MTRGFHTHIHLIIVFFLSLTKSRGGAKGGREGGREGEFVCKADSAGEMVENDVKRAETERTEDNRVGLVSSLPRSLFPSLPSYDTQGPVRVSFFFGGW